MHGLLLALSLTTPAHATPTWADPLADALGLPVLAAGELAAADPLGPARWALLPTPDRPEATLWWVGPSGAWLVPTEAESARAEGEAVRLGAMGPTGFSAHRDLAVRDGALAIVAEGHGSRYGSERLDWEAATAVFVDSSEAYATGADEVRTEAALLIAGADHPTPSWLTFGERRGPEDAGLEVRVSEARDRREQAVAVDLVARDDVHRPVPADASDAALVAGDHFELWILASPCDGSEDQLGQLGVARAADGTWQARWLRPGLGPVPTVSPAGEGVRVLLTEAHLGPGLFRTGACEEEPSYWGGDWRPGALAAGAGHALSWTERGYVAWRLTAAFSDADGRGGQEALVATSQLRFADPSSLGLVVVLPQGRWRPLPGAVRLR